MTSSLGDQLAALLGDSAPATPANTEAAGEESPGGVHGEVVGVLKQMAVEIPSASLETPLRAYGLDRLGIVELAVRCEEELGVRVEDEDIATFTTLGDVVNYVSTRRAN